MNPPKGLIHTSSTTRILFALVWLACSTILLSCKPAALPSAFSSSIVLPPTLTEVAIRQMLGTKESDFAHIEETETAFRQLPAPSQSPVFQSPPMLPTQPVSIAWPTILPGSDTTPAGAGIIVMRPSPGFGAPYRIGNQWIEDIHNGRTRIEVEAGVENGPDGLPSAQGIVIVEIWQRSVISNSVAVNRTSIDYYPTLPQAGPLKIIDAVGERLVIQSVTNGTKFYFDVPSRQFVPSMTAIVPTATIPVSPLLTPTSAP